MTERERIEAFAKRRGLYVTGPHKIKHEVPQSSMTLRSRAPGVTPIEIQKRGTWLGDEFEAFRGGESLFVATTLTAALGKLGALLGPGAE